MESALGGSTVLKLTGRLDNHTAPSLEKKLAEVATKNVPRLVIDCSGVEYVSSAGMRVFLLAVKQMQAHGGRCLFAQLSPELTEVFDVSGFSRIVEIRDTVFQATQS